MYCVKDPNSGFNGRENGTATPCGPPRVSCAIVPWLKNYRWDAAFASVSSSELSVRLSKPVSFTNSQFARNVLAIMAIEVLSIVHHPGRLLGY